MGAWNENGRTRSRHSTRGAGSAVLARRPRVGWVGAMAEVVVTRLGCCGGPDAALPADDHEPPALKGDRSSLVGEVLHDTLRAASPIHWRTSRCRALSSLATFTLMIRPQAPAPLGPQRVTSDVDPAAS